MSAIDTSLGSLRLRLDASHHAMLRDIRDHGGDESLSAALHRVVAERHAALFSARSVDAGASQPERPEGGPGQGEAQPPAPTIYRHPLVHVHHGHGRCVFGEECSR